MVRLQIQGCVSTTVLSFQCLPDERAELVERERELERQRELLASRRVEMTDGYEEQKEQDEDKLILKLNLDQTDV